MRKFDKVQARAKADIATAVNNLKAKEFIGEEIITE